ncbi:HDR097Cp [Eremothecium sinecaudum]|uniref:HDR097Cp n=1 Tax=Eremothecium sinecaudum TaxID=45286 RepID=A0A0X8HSW0_9SACH|nr:HDR097Cp [Eremothecium sinecaudum]AMD20839.1 HDR097Cp [Eremothecium sinecaudum]
MKVLRFNQDASCFSIICGPHSMAIYNCDPFGRCFELENSTSNSSSGNGGENGKAHEDHMGNFVTEMLFATSLIAVVNKNQGLQKAKKLRIVNTKRKSTICELNFPHEIVDVVMNRKRMCVLLSSEQIFVYDISCMKLLHTINVLEDKLKMSGSFHNHSSSVQQSHPVQRSRTNMVRIALSSDDKSILCYTAYCKSVKHSYLLNDLVIYDALNVVPLNYLNTVHKGNIACLCISNDGKLVATASEKGTIIRMFSTGDETAFNSNTALMYEFRRGTRPCSIHEMKIDRTGRYLACVGHTDTIHIFDLEKYGQGYRGFDDYTAPSMLGVKSAKANTRQIANFLSKRVISKISNHNMERDFAHIKVQDSIRHCIGFPNEFPERIYVASSNGEFHVWNIPQHGGECILVKSNKF